MSEIKTVWELFDEASREVTKDGEAWQNYLKFASRIYKYNFDNALQIYAQNKEATMLAEKTVWENRIGRTINKEHTNIAVFDVMSAKPQLRYLVDVSDTKGDEKTYPRLWRLTPENSMPLLERLKAEIPEQANSVEEYIVYEATRRIDEIRPGFYEGIKRNAEGSLLFGMADDELKAKVDVLVWSSAVYMMYSRCGFDTSGMDGHFTDISDFNNKSLLYRVGNCATIIAQDFLSRCATNLNILAKERREKAVAEKNSIEPKPTPPLSVKRSISDNIRKNAKKKAEENPAQISMLDENDEINTAYAENIVDDNENILTLIAKAGSVVQGGKQRIYEFFNNNINQKERAEFLKSEYGISGASVNTEDGRYFSWMSDAKGIEYYEIGKWDNKKHMLAFAKTQKKYSYRSREELFK